MQHAAYPPVRRLFPRRSYVREAASGTPMSLRAIAYCRVSTDEQARYGYGLEAQVKAIEPAVATRGWELLDTIVDDGMSGKDLERPGLCRALQMLADREADALVVAKLDRLSRSVVDFGVLLEWFTEAEATLLALDLDVDTSSPGGRLVANVFASVAEWERETIAARTRDALGVLRASGRPTGRPAVADRPEIEARIRGMRDAGMTLQAIADKLNEEGVPTARGATKWRPSSVHQATGYTRRKPRRKAANLPPIPNRRVTRRSA
jgi:DNA invertase Pin-like site-specific DNA recombinase